jgi:hypothetical protein
MTIFQYRFPCLFRKIPLGPDEEVSLLDHDFEFNEVFGFHRISVGPFFIHVNLFRMLIIIFEINGCQFVQLSDFLYFFFSFVPVVRGKENPGAFEKNGIEKEEL